MHSLSTSRNTISEIKGVLQYNEYPAERSAFLVVALVFYFILGASYYSFPMWLNQILIDHVDLSRQELTFLGGMPYVSLGLVGAGLLWYYSFEFSPKFEFLSASVIGWILVILSWILLLFIVETPSSAGGHTFTVVLIAMTSLGLGIGIFFLLWFGKYLEICKAEWKFVFNVAGNISFTIGAIYALGLKFVLTKRSWIVFMTVQVAVMTTIAVGFVFKYYDAIIVDHRYDKTEEAEGESKNDAKSYLLDLLFWKLQLPKERLAISKCDLSSRQFYGITLCYVITTVLATTFMANLGPLTDSSESNDDESVSEHSQLVIFIWSNVGQTCGRFSLGLMTQYIRIFFSFDGLSDKGKEVQESHIRNRTTLVFASLIGTIFLISSIVLQYSGNISFVYASTAISIGYGMVWCTSTAYAMFCSPYDYSYFLSFFQVFSSIGTLCSVSIVSGLQLDNASVFTLLLILSIGALSTAVLTLLDRLSTEVPPSKEYGGFTNLSPLINVRDDEN